MLYMTGCENPSLPQQPGPEKMIQGDVNLAEKIKGQIESLSAIDESTVVVLKEDVSIGVKVTGFHRLQLNTIRREVQGIVKDIVPDHRIHVTTDKRLFRDLQTIERHLHANKGKVSSKTLEELKMIHQKMQG